MDGWMDAWMDAWMDGRRRERVRGEKKEREGFWWKAKGGSEESWDAAKMHRRG